MFLFNTTKLWRRQAPIFMCGLVVLILCSGCVRRRMTVRSNPPGGRVFIDDREVGTSPVSVEYTYYGTRKIRVVKDGYETVSVKENLAPPWYQWPVVNFFSENLWPAEIRDERTIDINMSPQKIVPTNELIQRAQSLRQNAQTGTYVPLLK
ncbi:MAG: PEGA domain-containing protein [Pirellulaceae bacterium]|nr:PEGA domain-containing protein [Pirellulaceae bacterium]